MTEPNNDTTSGPALSGVAETLLIPLCSRSLESSRPDPIIDDPAARELVERLGVDCSAGNRDSRINQAGNVIRAQILDEVCARFLDRAAHPVVVTLGAGLCTRHRRMPPGRARWYDVDVPEVAELRRSLLSRTDDRQVIAASVLGDDWTEQIELRDGEEVLFIAEGLLMYFEPDDVRGLVTRLAHRFPGGRLGFDALGRLFASQTKRHPTVSETDAVFRWGIQDLRELEEWDPAIELTGQWFYLDRYLRRWGPFGLLRYVPPIRTQMKAGEVRFRAG